MGCGLRKFRQTEDNSPGKIYSTLKRPQVETKSGVAHTYQHLDFLVGKHDGTSTLCLSSVRELPSQLQDLYQRGFILAAVHPFVHPCSPEPASIQRQLYRAVLIKISDRQTVEVTQSHIHSPPGALLDLGHTSSRLAWRKGQRAGEGRRTLSYRLPTLKRTTGSCHSTDLPVSVQGQTAGQCLTPLTSQMRSTLPGGRKEI
ncbi:Raftlin Raft-linking protein [Triplophysa tibetana]|uniref:Raftlin Raft-linking protein n=1 Tax=Triplophysa tibetana TaxID=1572043 RepID=A0A5A9N0U8_9TELE|nr:Raftlin Raft-linking protein [Triplophysa tibetana]